MKRKGFTLVELLAVIAILAILVIIALPNVMGMFNTAKENSFRTEIKEVFKTAEQQWIQDSMYNTGEQTYRRCSGCSGKSLSLSGRTELEYYIKFNKSGEVVEFKATDGTFQYSYNNPNKPLKIEDINDVQKVADITNDSDLVVIGSDSSSYFDDYFCVSFDGYNVEEYIVQVPFKSGTTWKEFYNYISSNYQSLSGFGIQDYDNPDGVAHSYLYSDGTHEAYLGTKYENTASYFPSTNGWEYFNAKGCTMGSDNKIKDCSSINLTGDEVIDKNLGCFTIHYR